MRLIFVRHGEPNYEKDCLTETGLKQAKACAKRLEREGIERVFSSPQGRALQTAQEYAHVAGEAPITLLNFMHEISWGASDGGELYNGGHPWTIADKMVNEGYDLTRADWREHPLFSRNTATACADFVAHGIDTWLETLGYRREGAYYRQLLPGENRHVYALFSHGGSSTAALAHLLNMPFPYLISLIHMPFTSINILRFDAKEGSLCLPHLELSGDCAHYDIAED